MRASRPPTDLQRRFTRGDLLVTLALGLGLLAAGWVDLRFYWTSTGRATASFGLVNQQGDTRIEEDEFFHSNALELHLHNVGGLERDVHGPLRHAFGPDLTIEIWAAAPAAQVDFVFANDFGSQDLTVTHNDQVLEQIHLTPGRIERSYRVPLHAGTNRFTITFAVYNHHGIEFENGETRPVAGTFHRLDVHF